MQSRLTLTPEPQPEMGPVDGDQALDALAEWRTIHAPGCGARLSSSVRS